MSPLGLGRRRARHNDDRPEVAPEPVAAPVRPVHALLDPARDDELSTRGYTVFRGVLDLSEIDRLVGAFHRGMARWGQPLGDRWFPTILCPDPEVRALFSGVVSEVLGAHLGEFLDTEHWEVLRADYSVKPPSPDSDLGPHQDHSIVDERQFQSIYLWAPLEPMTDTNGALHILPGSQRICSEVRAQYVPFEFGELTDLVKDRSIMVDAQPGDVVVMVSGVVHWSPANLGDRVRLAVHGVSKPVDAPVVYFFADDQTPEGQVEMYEVEIDSYPELCLTGRPGPEFVCSGLRSRPPGMADPERFARGLAELAGADAGR